jgi:hypothetical protein
MGTTTTTTSRGWWARKEIVIIIGSISFAIGLLNYFFRPWLGPLAEGSDIIGSWITIISYFGIITGALMVARLGITNAIKQTPGTWYFEVAKVAVFLAALGIAFYEGVSGSTWLALVGGYYSPTGAAAKAIQGFYGISASYRAWRGRSWKTLIAMVLMFLVMLQMSPLGAPIHPLFNDFVDWFRDYLQGAAYRALTMATAFGGIYLGIRLFLGRELRVFGVLEAEAE